MMISRTLAIVAAIAASVGAAHAETIVTRSGEHDGFSRLVMRLPDGADWSLTQSGRTATLSIDQADAEFDTSQVFNLIPRTRIGAVSQRAPGQPLQLDLACNCDVSAYVLANGYLVVDVRGEEGELSSYTPTSNVLPLTAQGLPGIGFL